MKALIADNELYCRKFLQDLVEHNPNMQVPGIAVDADGSPESDPSPSDALSRTFRSIERLKQKWTAFTREIIEVIAREEIKISREEFDRQIGTRTR